MVMERQSVKITNGTPQAAMTRQKCQLDERLRKISVMLDDALKDVANLNQNSQNCFRRSKSKIERRQERRQEVLNDEERPQKGCCKNEKKKNTRARPQGNQIGPNSATEQEIEETTMFFERGTILSDFEHDEEVDVEAELEKVERSLRQLDSEYQKLGINKKGHSFHQSRQFTTTSDPTNMDEEEEDKAPAETQFLKLPMLSGSITDASTSTPMASPTLHSTQSLFIEENNVDAMKFTRCSEDQGEGSPYKENRRLSSIHVGTQTASLSPEDSEEKQPAKTTPQSANIAHGIETKLNNLETIIKDFDFLWKTGDNCAKRQPLKKLSSKKMAELENLESILGCVKALKKKHLNCTHYKCDSAFQCKPKKRRRLRYKDCLIDMKCRYINAVLADPLSSGFPTVNLIT